MAATKAPIETEPSELDPGVRNVYRAGLLVARIGERETDFGHGKGYRVLWFKGPDGWQRGDDTDHADPLRAADAASLGVG